MKVPKDIIYVGVNDHEVDLFEGQYVVPNGMAYNSYIMLDEKIAVFDTVDNRFSKEWLNNIEKLKDDYRIVAKMNLIENFGYKEIADNLDLPINTVKTKILGYCNYFCSIRCDFSFDFAKITLYHLRSYRNTFSPLI